MKVEVKQHWKPTKLATLKILHNSEKAKQHAKLDYYYYCKACSDGEQLASSAEKDLVLVTNAVIDLYLRVYVSMLCIQSTYPILVLWILIKLIPQWPKDSY